MVPAHLPTQIEANLTALQQQFQQLTAADPAQAAELSRRLQGLSSEVATRIEHKSLEGRPIAYSDNRIVASPVVLGLYGMELAQS